MLIEDQLLRHNDLLTSATRRPVVTRQGTTGMSDTQTSVLAAPSEPSTPDPTLSASVEQFSAPLQTSSVFPGPTTEASLEPSTQVPATTVAHTATQQPPASASPPAASGNPFTEAPHMALVPPTTVRTDSLGRDATTGQGTAPASPTLSPEEEDDIRNVIGEFPPPGHCVLLSSGNGLSLGVGERGERGARRPEVPSFFGRKSRWTYTSRGGVVAAVVFREKESACTCV